MWEAKAPPDVILIGTGSEVHIALEAGKLLQKNGIGARVVSLPSWEIFDAQAGEYRNEVLPDNICARVSIEAASPIGWERYVGLEGTTIGVPHFGTSAPEKVIYEQFGLTAQHVVEEASKLLHRS